VPLGLASEPFFPGPTTRWVLFNFGGIHRSPRPGPFFLGPRPGLSRSKCTPAVPTSSSPNGVGSEFPQETAISLVTYWGPGERATAAENRQRRCLLNRRAMVAPNPDSGWA